jgi:hypothetical protein
MNPVEREDDHHDEVRGQQPVIERRELVKMLERLIRVVRAPVMAKPLGCKKNEGCWRSDQLGEGKQVRDSVFGSIGGQFELYATLQDEAVKGHIEKRRRENDLYAENRASAEMSEVVLITRHKVINSGTDRSRENGPVFLHENDVGWNEANIDIAHELGLS